MEAALDRFGEIGTYVSVAPQTAGLQCCNAVMLLDPLSRGFRN